MGTRLPFPTLKKTLEKVWWQQSENRPGLNSPAERPKMRYPIVIERGSDTQAFGVIVPDLPGCFSAGDTFNEAIDNAQEAMTLWIEDALDNCNAVPKPSDLDTLRATGRWSGPEWIWGFVDVDPAILDEKFERVNITLPRRVIARLDRVAKEAGESRSSMIAKLALSA